MNGVSVLQNLQAETCEIDVWSFVPHIPLGIRNGFPYKNYGYFGNFQDILIHYIPVCLFDVSDSFASP